MSKHTLYRTTGIFGVAVLALTACGPEDDGGQEGVDDAAQEETDPDGAEEQGDTPGEIADEDGEEPDPDEEQDEEAGDAPSLADIEDSVWEASSSQDSVTITSDVPASMMGMDELPLDDEVDDLSEEDDADAEDPVEEEEEELLQIVVAGDMAGDGSVWQLDDLLDYLVYDEGGTIYQSVESFVEEYRQTQPDEAAGPDAETLQAELDAEGSWIDVTSALEGQIETPQQYVEDFRSEMLDAAGMDSMAESGMSGETETRDGEDVWVYRDEQDDGYVEFVILADEDEPLLSEISMDSAGTDIHISFTDWNEADDVAEDEPADEEVITMEELEAIGEDLT